MKPLYVIVEGDTEEEFFKNNLIDYFAEQGIFEVRPIKIITKGSYKGGFVNYDHLKRDAGIYLKQRNDTIVSTFIDYFRIPNNIPEYDNCRKIHNIDDRIKCLEVAMKNDIGSERFIPYIQKHEFEALLFSSNSGFEYCFEVSESKETGKIIDDYPNPEEINDKPATSPSNRLKKIRPLYNKVLEGNTIALEVGLSAMFEKCPRFKAWINSLVELVNH
ncbi:MAG TPA: DUF4276 family protein [Pyrinomonadaceae bacterium]|jgi:hypothetical protein